MTLQAGRADAPEHLVSIRLAFCWEGSAGEGLPGREGTVTSQPSPLQEAHSVGDPSHHSPSLGHRDSCGTGAYFGEAVSNFPILSSQIQSTLKTWAPFLHPPPEACFLPGPSLSSTAPILVGTMSSCPTPPIINRGSGPIARPGQGHLPLLVRSQ